MNENFNIQEVTTSKTVNIDNLGHADRRFDIRAKATYTDGHLRQLTEGHCTPVDADGSYAAGAEFTKYENLSINFGAEADVAATSGAIAGFMADIAEL